MKTSFRLFLMIALVVSAIAFNGCTKEKPATPKFDILKDYAVANMKDLPSILSYNDGVTTTSFVVDPPLTADVAVFIAKYYIIDIRTAADFALGRIQGAINIPPVSGSFAGVLTEAAKAGAKPILVVCYSGQQACYVTSLLRLYGYPKTQALKWGMSAWHQTFDKWTVNTATVTSGSANWNFEAAPAAVTFATPVLSGLATAGEALMKERVLAVLTEGFKTAIGRDLVTTPATHFINNYFTAGEWTGFGHIKGAFRINPLSIADNFLLNLDPSKKIATYCYTGQTSAIITAWLRVFGYDAYSVTYGMNGISYDNSFWPTASGAGNKWSVSKIKGNPTVTQ
ncbi:MAG: hypothetical protein C0408_06420 [Odoribacter sp.]|nr:hypothetical protein [Odoribacter sp.]